MSNVPSNHWKYTIQGLQNDFIQVMVDNHYKCTHHAYKIIHKVKVYKKGDCTILSVQNTTF